MLTLPKGMNEHYGQNVNEMPKILESDEVPISVAGIMQSRLNPRQDFPDLWNNWVDTSDLIVYPKGDDKDIYVLLTTDNKGQITKNGRKALELIRPDNLASNYGAIVGQLEDLQGEGLIKISRKNIKTDTYFTQDQVQNQQLWRVLARNPDEVAKEFANDKNLLKDYSAEVRERTRNNENMALYAEASLKDKTTLKAWYVSRLVNRSYAYGRSNLSNDRGRFLGIAPEAQGTEQKIKTYTPNQVKGALKELGFQGLSKTLIDKLNQ